MSTSMVSEIQQSIYDGSASATELLRKSYILSRKLQIREFEKWINCELKGYSNTDEIPLYRILTGEMRVWNPYHGWQHVFIEELEIQQIIQTQKCWQSLPEIESLLEKSDEKIHISIPDSASKALGIDAKCVLFVGSVLLTKIVEQVKNIILDWSLKLEEDGIMGEGMSFTKAEIGTASEKGYSIQNFYGNISGSQIQGHSYKSTQTQNNSTIDISLIRDIIKAIEDNRSQIPLAQQTQSTISECIKSINEEIETPTPRRSIISEGFKTIRNLIEGASGSIIASGILYKIDLFQ